MTSYDIRPMRDRTRSVAKKFTAYLPLALAVAALGATPAFATDATSTATHHHHRAAQSTRSLHMEVRQTGGAPARTESGREAAVRECSNAASNYSNSAWQTTQFASYGTCMSQHGQTP
jgi:hypothetical protein